MASNVPATVAQSLSPERAISEVDPATDDRIEAQQAVPFLEPLPGTAVCLSRDYSRCANQRLEGGRSFMDPALADEV